MVTNGHISVTATGVQTHRERSARLEREVERHGCAACSCDLCSDVETCAVAPARAVAARLPVAVDEVPETLESVFGRELAVY